MVLVDSSSIKSELKVAVFQCQSRGLLFSSKWASEQLEGLTSHANASKASNSTNPFDDTEENESVTTLRDIGVSKNEENLYILAKSYFDLKEYDRCFHLLGSCTSSLPVFLRTYSQYLSIEKLKQETMGDIFGSSDKHRRETGSWQPLLDIFNNLDASGKLDDPFMLYLFGTILNKCQVHENAIEKLIESVNIYPLNWSAWTELASCFSSYNELKKVIPRLPNHYTKAFFLLHSTFDLHPQFDKICHELLSSLEPMFGNSRYLLAQKAIALYHSRAFQEAADTFKLLHELDPGSVEYMDIYSNVLFVLEEKTQLSSLAHQCSKIDRYRPETCLVIGNYFSSKNQHEQAIKYFHRALRLNRSFTSAWTLMGHEYIELRNTHAALESYRRAIDISPNDYRAWYGLGQAYELLQMPSFALYYFKKAAMLRPYDGRMWSALSNIYDSLGMEEQSIAAYKRSAKDPVVDERQY